MPQNKTEKMEAVVEERVQPALKLDRVRHHHSADINISPVTNIYFIYSYIIYFYLPYSTQLIYHLNVHTMAAEWSNFLSLLTSALISWWTRGRLRPEADAMPMLATKTRYPPPTDFN